MLHASPHRAARTPPPAFLSLSLNLSKSKETNINAVQPKAGSALSRLKWETAAHPKAPQEAPVQNRDEPNLSSSIRLVNTEFAIFQVFAEPGWALHLPGQVDRLVSPEEPPAARGLEVHGRLCL